MLPTVRSSSRSVKRRLRDLIRANYIKGRMQHRLTVMDLLDWPARIGL